MTAIDNLTTAAIAAADLAVIAQNNYINRDTYATAEKLHEQVATAQATFDKLGVDDYTDDQDEQMLGYRRLANDAMHTIAQVRLHIIETVEMA